jgi:repressor LexA
MKGLTLRQREVFDFIRAFIHKNHYPPTIREIAMNFRFSVKGSYDHVKALEKKGYIRCHENRSRAIEVLRDAEGDPEALASVPLLGNVAAGRPLFAEENLQGHVQVPASSLGGGARQHAGRRHHGRGRRGCRAPEHGGQRRHRRGHGR